MDPILGSEDWKKVFRRSDFEVPFCGENGRKVICSVLKLSDFQN